VAVSDEGDTYRSPPLVVDPLAFLLGSDSRRAEQPPAVPGSPPRDSQREPGEQTERVTWAEPFGRREITIAANQDLAYELARVQVGANAVFILRRLWTYLDAGQGQGQGAFTTNQDTDPFDFPAQAGDPLRVEWSARVCGPEAGPLLGPVAPEALPNGRALDGLPRDWRDFRYAYNNRIGSRHHLVTQGPALLRFFVRLTSFDNAWTVTAAWLPSGYHQISGATGAALRAAIIAG
jgi:hypothetical protein